MQSRSIVSSSEAPTLLQGLQAKAHSGLQATVEAMKEQIDVARQAADHRVNVAKAGKRLLDNGGEDARELVVAKNASHMASELDGIVAHGVHVAIAKLEGSIAKVAELQSTDSDSMSTSMRLSLPQLANQHEARLANYMQIAQMLETRVSHAEMSPEEFDALAIVRAKAGCSAVMSTAAESLSSMSQKALTSVTSLRGGTVDVSRSPQAVHTPTLLEGLQDNATAGLHKMKQAVNDRVETAKAGKQLLEEGGERAVLKVLTKDALLDAANADRDVAMRVQSAISAFDYSTAKLKGAEQRQGSGDALRPKCGAELVLLSKLSKLAEEHAVRAGTYKQIASMLETSIGSIGMDVVERDALSIIKMRESCGEVQCRAQNGFQAIKNMAVAGCVGLDTAEYERRIVNQKRWTVPTVCA